MFGKDSVGGASLTVLFGLFGVLAPFASIYVATFMGKSDMAMINSSMLMFLSVLLMVFLVINSFHNFLNNNKKVFLIGIIFLLFTIISFIFNLNFFIKL
ncbi:MAG: hypothetical protein ACOX1V_02950 [Candidatus Iainarchaeum sp.]|jgi:uncharacterized membrane protein|nr:MAG: hypothetical protein BWY55_00134 [archaeon ADurb.Bin336]